MLDFKHYEQINVSKTRSPMYYAFFRVEKADEGGCVLRSLMK